jgi:DtxR family Mn-dependent transcriptional regulator
LEVCHVANQSVEMLDILRHNQISIGTNLEVRKHFSFDNSLEIRIGKQQPFILSEAVAKHIWVKKTDRS